MSGHGAGGQSAAQGRPDDETGDAAARVRVIGAGAGIALMLLAALLDAWLVLKVWVACDLGAVNAGASLLTVVLFGFPALLVVHAALLAAVTWLARRLHAPRALGVALLLIGLVVVTFAVTQVATPPEPSLTCPTGVPEWWPSWLPHRSYGA